MKVTPRRFASVYAENMAFLAWIHPAPVLFSQPFQPGKLPVRIPGGIVLRKSSAVFNFMNSASDESISCSCICLIKEAVWPETIAPVSWKYGWNTGSFFQPFSAARVHVEKAILQGSVSEAIGVSEQSV